MDVTTPPMLARLYAGWWYLWGLSLCQVGLRTADRSVYQQAIAAFDRALAVWPTMSAVLYRRGLIRGRELGEYLAAIRDLDHATALRPEWPEPYLQRGLFHRFNGEAVDAIADLSAYLQIAPAGYWRDEAERQMAILRGETGI